MVGTFYNPFDDRQDVHPVSHCSHCHGEIYDESLCYLIGGQVICDACLEDDEKEHFNPMTGRDLDRYFNLMYGGLDDID